MESIPSGTSRLTHRRVVRISGKTCVVLGFLLTLIGAKDGEDFAAMSSRAWTHDLPIPAFARMYGTTCSTCHTAAPKLNVLGEAFRLNGYRMPQNQVLLELRDDPIPLGDPAWADEWPRGIWPGELPAQLPLALRFQLDGRATRDESQAATSLELPSEVYLLAGTNLGGSISVFLESEWQRSRGAQVVQAKAMFQDPIPNLPDRLVNLWIGLQNPYLLTLADRQIDRAGRTRYRWQSFRPSQLTMLDGASGTEVQSENRIRVGWPQPTVEINGLISPRFYYGLGLAQGVSAATTDSNDAKDLYYKLRYKFGGLDLQGRYAEDDGPVTGSGGQLLDRSLILEHFGYFGAQPVSGGVDDSHHALGASARLLYGRWDLGVGWVRTEHRNPWGLTLPGELETSAIFGKAEYLFYPWLMGSLKAERHSAESVGLDPGWTFSEVPGDVGRIIPGIVFLARQNVRGVIEGEFLLQYEDGVNLPRKPHTLWWRLDLAF